MEAKSLGDMFRSSCKKYGGKVAHIMPDGSSMRNVTYTELYVKVKQFAGALKSLGLKRGDTLCIWSENSLQWVLTDWAAQTLGVTTAPIYPTLPVDQAEYIVKDCGAKVLLYGSRELGEKATKIANAKSYPMVGDGSLEAMAALHENEISLEEWDKLIDAVDRDDLATIIYTSGTTGLPKGAMLTHRCFTSLCDTIDQTIPITADDTFLCFLPYSHVYARLTDHILIVALGCTAAQVRSLMTMANDMATVKPTIVTCVPRFLENFVSKIEDNLAKQPPLKQKIFALAKSQNLARARGKFAPLARILDKLAFEPIRAKTGGRIRFFVSGGAALPTHVEEMFAALGMTVLQGYGLTETTAGTSFNSPDNNKPWTVGVPVKCTEVEIAPDGEILVRGPSVMKGYYNLPKETAEAIDENGWFHTGDIGHFEGQHLRITDRKKDLLVLANGKNVAPQPIENRIKESAFIDEAVVLGDGMEYCIALIVPNQKKVREKLNLPEGVPLEDNPEVKKFIKSEIDKINKTLANFELVKKFALLEQGFSIETGELTPSLKVKRKVVKEKFADNIATLSR